MTPRLPVHNALHANLAVIRQGITLLAALGANRYKARVSLCYNASVGGHLRHIIEHYQSFLDGLSTGTIDYENRRRDSLVENDAGHATDVFESIHDQILELGGTLSNRRLLLQAETSLDSVTETSVLRELEFLLSHTIHHYALVAVMARLQGCEPEPAFGIAPSTLKFQQAQALCAR